MTKLLRLLISLLALFAPSHFYAQSFQTMSELFCFVLQQQMEIDRNRARNPWNSNYPYYIAIKSLPDSISCEEIFPDSLFSEVIFLKEEKYPYCFRRYIVSPYNPKSVRGTRIEELIVKRRIDKQRYTELHRIEYSYLNNECCITIQSLTPWRVKCKIEEWIGTWWNYHFKLNRLTSEWILEEVEMKGY